jgi:hypothetical protein
MAKILQFPSAQIQGMAFLEDQLRELLRGKGADRELMDFAASTVKEIYQRNVEAENYSFSLSLPEVMDAAGENLLQQQIAQGIAKIREENHAVIVRLIAELALAQVQVFQLSRGRDPG